ncbi:MAG: sensor histidine kinase [Acidimicrobiia bacterium]
MADPRSDRAFRITLGDAATVITLFVLAWLGDLTYRAAAPEPIPTALATDLALIACLVLPLLVRRRFPLTVLIWSTAIFLWIRIIEVPEPTATAIAMFVALFSAGAYSHHRWRNLARGAALAVSFGVLIWGLITHGEGLPGNVVLIQVFQLAINVAFYAAAWLMGDLWRHRVEDQAELARRADTLDDQRHLLATQAVANERLRIAQELHDIVGHHVSVMGVQAGAARRSLPEGADRAAEVLTNIEASGRQAVAEMGRLVGFLRDSDSHPTSPLPTLADLDHLVDQSRAAGLDVVLHRVGMPRSLEPASDLSAFRVVQEALTNALKHGGGRASVEIAYLVEHLALRVRNPAPQVADHVGGRGLMGMEERVALVGGTIRTGRTPDGGFEVAATLPYGAAS